jgi:HAMP domain-containing protein
MSLKQKVMERGMKLMSDPRVTKVLSNPKLMNVVMKGFQLRGQAQAAVDTQLKAIARRLRLATRDEVGELKQTIRVLEQSLRQVQSEVYKR